MSNQVTVFPEMRAQLRTYHAIPSLQAHQDPNSYKQLQDAPRLKSILKGASEDRPEPNTLEKIKDAPVPRTNPVNLIFVLAQFAPKITDLHFPPPRDFYDLIMRTTITSQSRATAFLWLMWFYLESDFTEEGADENPFGPGVDYNQNLRNQGIPHFTYLTEEGVMNENVDTPEEVEYGLAKMKERRRIIEADQAALQAEYGPTKRGPKPKLNLPLDEAQSPAALLSRGRASKYDSDIDSTRSTPPPRAPNMRIQSVLNAPKSRGSLKHQIQIIDSSSPGPSGFSHIIMNTDGTTRRSRPLTAHQLAVEHNRNQRVNYILSRGLRRKHHQAKKLRKLEGAILRGFRRIQDVPDPFEDSEGEETLRRHPGVFREKGFAGLIPLSNTEDDFGEELSAYAAAFRRMGRRLDRWDGHRGIDLGVVAGTRVQQGVPVHDDGNGDEVLDDTEDEKPIEGGDGDEEDLDDMDKELLGLASDNEEREDLDDVEKALLGIGGDETEDDVSDGGMDVD
jgi:Ino eighty subunit 1